MQFYEMESFGKQPKNPELYYLKLCDGKKWFSVQQADIKKTFGTWEWCGWYCYWKDFEGKRWILRHLMAWHPDPPEWLFNDEEPPWPTSSSSSATIASTSTGSH